MESDAPLTITYTKVSVSHIEEAFTLRGGGAKRKQEEGGGGRGGSKSDHS